MNRLPVRRPVLHACDACRRRKVKCNGQQPCPGCVGAQLPCTFDLPQRKGGNRGSRARILNQLRAGSEESTPVSSSAFGERESFPTSATACGTMSSVDFDTLDSALIDACVEAYLTRIRPVVGLVSRDVLLAEIGRASSSLLSKQFVVSFCAYVVTFGKISEFPSSIPSPLQNAEFELGERLLDAALRTMDPGRISRPCAVSVYISFFLYGAHAGLGDYRQGWFYLREATTLFLMMREGDREEWFDERVYRCLFWVLLVSERAHAIRRNRPTTLQIASTTPFLSLESPHEYGLHYLSCLFRPFDSAFFDVWNGARRDCSKAWLLSLENDVRTALPLNLGVSDEQVANLRASQLWLQIKLWELFPKFGFLSSESVYECLTFRYPVGIARDLAVLGVKVGTAALQVHGVGMTEKIFDIACALADVLPFLDTSTSQFELGPIDYLRQTTALLTKLPGGPAKFVPLLLAKVNELMPELIKALCDAAGVPNMEKDAMSPDSRSVYDDEVGTGLYADLRKVKV